ncbi:MAG: hypothetical protein COA96_16915 [SAR86 cluster bacterium]|uniref:Uncharacterized protein n=1 Tax=SAR86 cluster bacterium TaxID=2030880 RepID=A0A2A5AGU5_9GAMM|nr:MAG: hypothetical protein COA96_16915 [SAR86 cluster bacterium]
MSVVEPMNDEELAEVRGGQMTDNLGIDKNTTDALLARLDDRQRIVDKLPRKADGSPVVLGDKAKPVVSTAVRAKRPGVGLSRSTDPDTSKRAGSDAAWANSDSKTAAIVLGVMCDGVPRIDAEIYDKYIEMTSDLKPLSASRLRHGRKHAVDLKMIAETGLRRRGPDGGKCREWINIYVPTGE